MANLRVDKITSTETFETTGSVQFDGNNDKLIVGSAGDFNYLHNGAASFTAEFWVYTKIANSRQVVFSTGGNSSSTGFVVRIMASGAAGSSNGYLVGAQTSKSSSGNYLYWDSESTQLSADTWYHIATVYDHTDNTLKIYVNGKLTNSGLSRTQGNFGDHATGNSQAGIYIGEEAYNNSLDLNGFVSNLRIINGVKLYTSNFKPPMKELEVTAETTVLCCQSKTNELLEKTGKTIVMNGTAKACELTPGLLTPIVKSGGGSAITGSVEFVGAPAATVGSDYLNVSSTDFAFGTSDFSVEMWFNSGDVSGPGQRGLIQLSDTAGGLKTNYTSGFVIATGVNNAGQESGNDINSHILGDELGSNTQPLKNDSWHHVALTRQSGTARLFLNGVLLGSSSAAESISAEHLVIGGWYSTSYLHKGFISNLRIVRGTALYTDSFIPPTTELKRVPGTVLLCCQDPNNPLTEATGKTITGYGNLDQVYNTQLVPNGDFSNGINDWSDTGSTATLSVSSGQMTITNSSGTNGRATGSAFKTTIGARYVLKYDAITSGGSYRAEIREGGGAGAEQAFESTTDGATETFEFQATHSQHSVVIYSIGANGIATKYDNVYVYKLNPGKTGSNFTPQVGDDRKVTFEGVTKINSDAYFYLPTGDTESRDKGAGTRGISLGGTNPSRTNIISYINISTTGNAQNFGDLLDKINQQGSAASSTRGISAGGFGTSPSENEIVTVNYITIASAGDALDFGDLTLARRLLVGCSSQTRGIFAGGYDSPNKYNTMDYVTIATQGDALDFGDMVADGQTPSGRYSSAGYASPTRGVWHGGYGYPAYRNIIDYVTISSKGNTKDFGDTSISNYYMGGCSNSIRGISGGAYNPSPAHINLIEYTTIATTGNAQDFGDLPQKMMATGACASQIRGVFLGGQVGGAYSNNIVYVTIMTMGNALDFGDLTTTMGFNAGCSNGHGGLG